MSDEKKPYIINGERVTLEEYRKTKYEDLRIRVPKGKKEIIKKHVKSTYLTCFSVCNLKQI